MSVWICEQGDGGGIEVFQVERADPWVTPHETEAAAIEYGLSCAEVRRDALAASIAHMKRRRRAIFRKARP